MLNRNTKIETEVTSLEISRHMYEANLQRIGGSSLLVL